MQTSVRYNLIPFLEKEEKVEIQALMSPINSFRGMFPTLDYDRLIGELPDGTQ